MSYLDKINRFVKNPTNLDISRSRFDISFRHTTSYNSGDLVPLGLLEVLPGDTFDVGFSFVQRMITPAVPVMDNAFLDVFFFFVPNRLCTVGRDDWPQICGENFNSAWAPISEETLETTGNTATLGNICDYLDGIQPGSVANYFGLPILPASLGQGVADEKINLMPFIGYIKIWNEFFRDQNVQDPILITDDSILQVITNTPLNVNKIHDYFTSCLPSPQKGEPVLLPIGDVAPIMATFANNTSKNTDYVFVANGNGSKDVEINKAASVGATGASGGTVGQRVSAEVYADLSNATGSSINQLRQAFAIQRMLEKDARGGRVCASS